jgi:hypothetical protein
MCCGCGWSTRKSAMSETTGRICWSLSQLRSRNWICRPHLHRAKRLRGRTSWSWKACLTPPLSVPWLHGTPPSCSRRSGLSHRWPGCAPCAPGDPRHRSAWSIACPTGRTASWTYSAAAAPRSAIAGATGRLPCAAPPPLWLWPATGRKRGSLLGGHCELALLDARQTAAAALA